MAYKFQMDNMFASGALSPAQDDKFDLGAGANQWKDLYINGTASIDELRADKLGASLDCNSKALTNVDVNSGNIDGTTIGASSAAAATVTTLSLTAMGANWTNASFTVADMGTVTTMDLNGGTIDGVTIGGASAGAGTFAALVGTSLSVSDGNITNVGDLNCDSVSVDDANAGLDISFAGSTTGNNKLSLTDNLADALNITEAGNSYIKFTTTDASELITFGKNSTFTGTSTVLGTVTAATSITATDLIGTNIDGIIGAGTARAGTFTAMSGTTLGATTITANSIDLQGGTATVGGLTAESNLDIGAYDLRAATLTADGLTSTRVVFAGANGVLSDDSDMTFAGDTLTVTKLGAFEAAGSIDFSDEIMTNVNVDSGAVDGVTIGANAAGAGTFTSLDCTDGAFAIVNLDIDGGTDIGAAIVDADLFIIDDGATGLNRKCTASRLKTYIQSGAGDSVSVATLSLLATCSAGLNVVTGSNVAMQVCLPSGSDGDVVYVKAGSQASPNAKVTVQGSAGDAGAQMDGQKTLALESPYAQVGFIYSNSNQAWSII